MPWRGTATGTGREPLFVGLMERKRDLLTIALHLGSQFSSIFRTSSMLPGRLQDSSTSASSYAHVPGEAD